MGDAGNKQGEWAQDDVTLILSILNRAQMTFWAGAGEEDNYAIRLWNPGAEQIYGHPRESALGKSYVDLFVNPSERAQAIEDHGRIVANDEVYQWDWAADDLTKDGEVRTMLTHCFRVEDPKGGGWLLAELGIDISDFNKASQQLRKLKEVDYERRELTFAKNSREIGRAVARVGVNGSLDKVIEEIFSAVRDAVSSIGRCTLWISEDDDLARYEDPATDTLNPTPYDEEQALELALEARHVLVSDSERSFAHEHLVRRKERRGRKRAFGLFPLRGIRSTEPLGVLATALGKSAFTAGELARLETLAAFIGPLLDVALELQRSRKERLRALRAETRQQVFRSVMHTVGSSVYELGGILETFGAVEARTDLDPDLRELLMALRSKAQQLGTSLSDLRSHIDAAEEEELIPIRDAVFEVVNPLKINQPTIACQVEVDPDHTVFIVGHWLHHILQNLVSNAAQIMMTQYGGGDLLIRSVREEDNKLQIHIEDSGPGVDPQVQATLFDQGVTLRDGGHGDGLFITRDLVTSSGGEVVLLPEPSPRLKGAHFRIELPSRRDAE